MSVLINTGDYAAAFGTVPPVGTIDWVTSFDYTGTFNVSTLNYNVANNAFSGPLQDPIGMAVGDFNGDGLPDFVAAEQYDVALMNQAYPFFSSDPLDLNTYTDEWPDTDLSFGFSGRYSVIPDDGPAPRHLLRPGLRQPVRVSATTTSMRATATRPA